MTNVVQYDAARLRQARDLRNPEFRLHEDGNVIELTLYDSADQVVAILEYRLNETVPKDFDLSRLVAFWDVLRGTSTAAS
jgi:hypothetical protein